MHRQGTRTCRAERRRRRRSGRRRTSDVPAPSEKTRLTSSEEISKEKKKTPTCEKKKKRTEKESVTKQLAKKWQTTSFFRLFLSGQTEVHVSACAPSYPSLCDRRMKKIFSRKRYTEAHTDRYSLPMYLPIHGDMSPGIQSG